VAIGKLHVGGFSRARARATAASIISRLRSAPVWGERATADGCAEVIDVAVGVETEVKVADEPAGGTDVLAVAP
jgi:hypothetical protein